MIDKMANQFKKLLKEIHFYSRKYDDHYNQVALL